MEIGFSVNEYDSDGDIWDRCVKIYFGENVIIKFKNLLELDEAIYQLQKCSKEIKEST